MKERDISVYLHDILESIDAIESYAGGVSKAGFLADPKTQDSVVRRLEVIGEAVRSIPHSVRDQHTDVPWREIAGMRDVLIHEYFGISMDRVWETIEDDLPKLKKRVQEIIEELTS